MKQRYKPRVHQQELMDFHLESRMIGTLAWHGMGLGKTLSALWLARKQIQKLRALGVVNPKFLVLVPKSAIPTWKVECSEQTPEIMQNMVLAPISQMHNLVNRVKYADIRFIIIDESHGLKAPDTNRLASLANLVEEIGKVNGKFDRGRVICLSGTPMPNGAMELYTTFVLCTSPTLEEMAVRLRDEKRYTQWKQTFARKKETTFERYDPSVGKKVPASGSSHRGVQNEDMLNTLLKEFVHFRRVSDCIDLPKSTDNYIDLNLNDDKLLADADIEKPEAYMALQERLARAKAPYMYDWVKDFLAGDTEQLVVFSGYTEPLRTLAEKFKKDVRLITGAEDDETRAKNLRDFQQGKYRVIGLTFRCGSEALNLQNAFHSLYHGFPWHDAMLRQAMARTARSGQLNPTFHHFLTSGVNDQKILGIVRAKAHATTTVEDLLLENKSGIMISLVDSLI